MRVAIVFDNFGPYHVARIAGAARDADVLAVEVRGKSAVYDWEAPGIPTAVRHTQLLPPGMEGQPTWRGLMDLLDARVGGFRPDAVALPGWSTFVALGLIAWASERSIPTIAMSETNQADFRRINLIEKAKATIARSFSAGLVGGHSARRYLVALGLPETSVFLGYNAVDNGYFDAAIAQAREQGLMPLVEDGKRLDPRWRKKFFLASARFIEKKNLPALLDAYACYRTHCAEPAGAWPLVILGDGALRPALEARRRQLGLEDAVHMPGFIQYGDLPGYYAAAGAFVHASTTEQWGLVVNEAMASGLPVAVSSRCGCAEMLVADGVNGFTFDPFETTSIADALVRLADHPDPASLGRASRSLIADWGPERFGKGLLAAAEAACQRGAVATGDGAKLLLRSAAIVQARRG